MNASQCQSTSGSKRAIVLTSYTTGAASGKNLGACGYSYEFVVSLFSPLLKKWGELIRVNDAATDLAPAIASAKNRGLDPIHVSFLPFQDVQLAPGVPNVVVPAWEFPDIPDHVFDGNPQNDWVETSKRCSVVVVGGPFTANAFQRGGITTPIRIVPVPTIDPYFQVPRWHYFNHAVVDCQPVVLPQRDVQPLTPRPTADTDEAPDTYARPSFKERLRRAGHHGYKRIVRRMLPARLDRAATAAIHAGLWEWKQHTTTYSHEPRLDLSGVVYTSIFNPDDGRKNWDDLLTAYLVALRDCEDATLVVKLITSRTASLSKMIEYYRGVDIDHKCKLVFVKDYLTDEQMLSLVAASTYYITSTRAEGNCLPVMNYLAAARPSITPAHSAIGDYFDDEVGFVVESHPELAAWPHDTRLRKRTTWGRMVWTSLVDQIRKSYDMARHDREAYDAMATRAQQRMLSWASYEAVWPRLKEALDLAASPTLREEAGQKDYSKVAA